MTEVAFRLLARLPVTRDRFRLDRAKAPDIACKLYEARGALDIVRPKRGDQPAGQCLEFPDQGALLAAFVAVSTRIRPAAPQSFERLEKMQGRSEENKSELQSLMRTSYAVFCL